MGATQAGLVVGVAGVVIRGNSILLVKRLGTYAGTWCIPCGHIEPDEDVRAAAVREVHEETGLEVTVGGVIDVLMTVHASGKRTVGIWFETREVGGSLRAGDDAQAAEFFRLDGLPNEMAFEADRKVIAKLLADRPRERLSGDGL